MASISLKNLSKTYLGGVEAVKDFSVDISDGEFVVIVGPSGCGKSTVLRMIAGLEQGDAGDILSNGISIAALRPQQRNVAMVFQNYALYGAMTVFQNIAVGLEKTDSKEIIEQKVQDAAELLKIGDLLKRHPETLSGGQQQRVALARTMVRDPIVFLLDEPLSGLDAKQRDEMRAELIQIHRRSRATVLYVTHDQTEAMTLGDRIIVMRGGTIQQIGTPDELYNNPTNTFVAGFLGSPPMNLIAGTISVTESGAVFHGEGGIELSLESCAARDEQAVFAGIRSEDVRIQKEDGALKATVVAEEYHGSERIVTLKLDRLRLRARTRADETVAVGARGSLLFRLEKLHLFDGTTGQRI